MRGGIRSCRRGNCQKNKFGGTYCQNLRLLILLAHGKGPVHAFLLSTVSPSTPSCLRTCEEARVCNIHNHIHPSFALARPAFIVSDMSFTTTATPTPTTVRLTDANAIGAQQWTKQRYPHQRLGSHRCSSRPRFELPTLPCKRPVKREFEVLDLLSIALSDNHGKMRLEDPRGIHM